MANPLVITEINVGTSPNDGTGATLRAAFIATNENFANLTQFLTNNSSEFLDVTVHNSLTANTITANVGTFAGPITAMTADFNSLSVDSLAVTYYTDSTSPTTGSITVNGGVGVLANVNVGSSITAGGTLQGNALTIVGVANSTSPITGAATIAGGLGVVADTYLGSNLYVTGAITAASANLTTLAVESIVTESITADTINVPGGVVAVLSTDSLTVTNSATIGANLDVASNATVGGILNVGTGLISTAATISDLSSTTVNTGALTATGAVSAGGNATVGGTLDVFGATALGSTLSVATSLYVPTATIPTLTSSVGAIADLTSTGVNTSTLSVTNYAIINGDLTVSTDLAVLGSLDVGGETTIAPGSNINLPTLPTLSNHVANKSYVDALVTSSTTWRDPVVSPSLVGVTGAQPATPTIRVSWIKYGGTQNETWTGTTPLTSVVDGDIVEYNTITTSWVRIGTLSTGDRFIVAGEHGTIDSSLFGADIRNVDLIQYVSGDPSTAAAWTKPHADNNQAVEFSVNKTLSNQTGLTNTAIDFYTATVKVNATSYPIAITGAPSHTYTTLLASINTDLIGATATIISGHIHITGSLTTDRILITDTNLFSSMTDFVDIRGSALPGTTVLCNTTDSGDSGHSYLFSGGDDGNHSWTEISGPGSINAGTGLTYSGNTLNVNTTQPQITAVGTLTNLVTTGTVTTNGHILSVGAGTANIGSGTNRFATVYATTFNGLATSANYADLAEKYQSDLDYLPGTVLVFGGSREVTTTSTFADVSVAGAVSTDPAYLMNFGEVDAVAVALRGKVPMLVAGPVTKGDLLVTSDIPGCAQSVQKDGSFGVAIFAKAIETNTSNDVKLVQAVIL